MCGEPEFDQFTCCSHPGITSSFTYGSCILCVTSLADCMKLVSRPRKVCLLKRAVSVKLEVTTQRNEQSKVDLEKYKMNGSSLLIE